MRLFPRIAFVVVLAVVGIVMVVVGTAYAEANTPTAARSKAAVRYGAARQPMPGAPHVESVLTEHSREALARTQQGTGWLLHYGPERDTCTRPDATSRLRMLCIGW